MHYEVELITQTGKGSSFFAFFKILGVCREIKYCWYEHGEVDSLSLP